MTVAKEEILGPVLVVVPSATREEEALQIANDRPYVLGGYVFGRDCTKGYEFASRLRAGRVSSNGAASNSVTPMGGYKQSGIGGSMGEPGLREYLQVKTFYGFEEEASTLATFGNRRS